MSPYRDKVELLIEQIRSAFDGVSRQSGISLHQAWVIDEWGTPAEQAAARESDTDRHWEEIPEHLLQDTTALSYFCPLSFVYYIPAYLIVALRKFSNYAALSEDERLYSGSKEGDRVGSVIFSLTILDKPGLRELKLSNFEALSSEQAQVICRVLRFLSAYGVDGIEERAEKALRAYWGQFCDAGITNV
jgi:hypothetical protein